MLRFGILGAGRIGNVHARSIASSGRAKVSYIADAMPDAASKLAEVVGAKTAPLEEVIAASDVDAILIATPTDTHADLIEMAARAGKAILCEKPVSLSVSRIEECLKVVDAAGVPLMIGFHRRYDPNFSVLEKRLRAGEIGDPEIITITCRDPSAPPVSYIERSGGLYRDMMIHDFDMARFLLGGEEVATVHALGGVMTDPAIGKAGDIDTAAVHMQTASGKMVVITNSRRATYGHDQRIEVHGSKGLLRAANIHNTTVELANENGWTEDAIPFSFVERYQAAYTAEIHKFLDYLEKGEAPRASGHDGLMAQKLAEAATESLKTGSVIKL
ncbi:MULTISPECIES: inositol 2-dehydrogenase [unclassified Devosia]|uniref:inositol 2-dehydrogenase n=1 Tax=unclassified Devosia TaxID=196773 RepID=UPI0015FAB11F|nr:MULTISPECIES: inositol 2-dehydrogenase [unclassified Devosia]MBJ6985846.1 inositol 2-dehydrogenase [Devosia sp. MC521]MBJ7577942.1 inositol 2-dehydrogenase [Devosia sp. MC532]QMW61223.1 inositol 2-dehydrogenase [Devosia sp. MC521]